MNLQKAKIISIVGSTASGKSELAVWLAQKIKGEVISADSRQVYRELDIGTGKITKKEMRGVRHHLIDIASPKRKFNVLQFQTRAKSAITKITRQGSIPILCGGTGFYIDALVYGINFPSVSVNHVLRKKLARKTPDELFQILIELAPERANNIDSKNPRRLIRAIEIAIKLGTVEPTHYGRPKYETLSFGIQISDEQLRINIHKRLIKRVRQGLIAEVKELHKRGLSLKRMEELGLEYRFIARHLSGRLKKNEMLQQLENSIYQYSKRQKTWFKRNKDTIWIAPEEKQKTLALTKVFLSSGG